MFQVLVDVYTDPNLLVAYGNYFFPTHALNGNAYSTFVLYTLD